MLRVPARAVYQGSGASGDQAQLAGLLADPAGVVPRGDQQGGGDLGGHAPLDAEPWRGGPGEEFLERGIQPGDLG